MLLSACYDLLLLLLALIALPKLLWQRFKYGKYQKSIKERLGWKLPPALDPKKGEIFWLHVVSVGEAKAASSLYHKIRSTRPNAQIVISSITETGQAEAKRSLPNAQAYFFLPLDFSWIMKRVVRRIQPDLLILVEGEFWYHLLKAVKDTGGKTLLVNGKLSDRSYKRFKTLHLFSKKLFSLLDHLCLQSSSYKERFCDLGVPAQRLTVTGNLKLDAPFNPMNAVERTVWQKELGIDSEDRVVTIGSTHETEEELLLTALEAVWRVVPRLKILIVPRHPERFLKVADLLQARKLPYCTYTQRHTKRGDERVILIDSMGKLMSCFQLAEVALVAGSFISSVGGHNIFEPTLAAVPVLFGPYMHGQSDLTHLVLKGGAGIQTTHEQLSDHLLTLLSNKSAWEAVHNSCLKLVAEVKGSTERTWGVMSGALRLEVN